MECPLKEADLKSLNKAIFMLNDMINELDKAKKAGIDVEEIEIRRIDLANKLSAMKEAYFPGR